MLPLKSKPNWCVTVQPTVDLQLVIRFSTSLWSDMVLLSFLTPDSKGYCAHYENSDVFIPLPKPTVVLLFWTPVYINTYIHNSAVEHWRCENGTLVPLNSS